MSEFRRSQMDTLCKRLSEPPHRLIVVTGARQTGKTTATRQAVSSLRRPYRYEAADMPDERGVQAVPNLSQAVPYLSTEDGEGSVSFSAVRNPAVAGRRLEGQPASRVAVRTRLRARSR